MLNKLQFNNLVITNKKKIQQVKTQTIQKFVQKIRKLKTFIEKKPDDKKAQERFRKNTLCLEELKKMKPLDLMKHVLVLDKSTTAVLTNARSTPEEVALAMVASNKIMQTLAQHFREELQLKDSDTKWKEEIMRASKRRIKISRTEYKRQKRQEGKNQKALAQKRVEWLKDQNQLNATSDDETAHEDANVSTLGVWKIEPIEKETMPKNTSQNKKSKIITEKRVRQQNVDANDTNIKVKEPKPKIRKAPAHSENIGVKVPQLDNDFAGSAAEKIHKESEYRDPNNFDDSLQTAVREQEDESSAVLAVTHVVDPFFITESGENYRSTAVIMRDGKIFEPTIKPVERTNKWNGAADKERWNPVDRSFNRKSHNEKSFDRTAVNKRNLPNATHSSNTDGMHPSWVAKQKIKPIITAFQGKKIKISDDDDGNNVDIGAKNHIQVNTYVTTATKRNAPDNRSQPALHPSWEAKQKLKPIITDFKGKKITFDDNAKETAATGEGSKPVAQTKNFGAAKKVSNASMSVNADLHPSWAAKQKLKPTITSFQGKKITFDADGGDA